MSKRKKVRRESGRRYYNNDSDEIVEEDYLKKCACGCGEKIIFKPHHKWKPVQYISGHNRRGVINSVEHREKNRQSALKQFKNGMPQDTIKKIVAARKGWKHTETSKIKIGLYWKGKPVPIETRIKISKTLTNKQDFTGFHTNLNKIIRRSEKYKLWRDTIKKRDVYTCQECGEKRSRKKNNHVNIEVHHIIPIYELITKFNIQDLQDANKCEDFWDINNGIVLCSDCHRKCDDLRWEKRKKN